MQTLSEDNFKVLLKVRPLMVKEKEEISAYEQAYMKKMKNSTGTKTFKLSPAAYAFYTKYYNCNVNEIIKINSQDNTIFIADPQYKNTDRKMKPFSYSAIFHDQNQNVSIFNNQLKEYVHTVLEGYNCTILAYGITGSGKTYTIFGGNKQIQSETDGISYQTFDYILQEKKRMWEKDRTKINLTFSFIEIYNENVKDLLAQSDSKYLNVVEDGKGNTTVADMMEIPINCMDDILQGINAGTSKRVFASTAGNQYSSRSHAILQLNVEIQNGKQMKSNCKLFIIDLAGSEKLQTLNCSRKMQQGANINRSLLALGNCINTLAENSRKNITSHIPYRDSKLTRLLKDSLGGNTKTIMIACVTPNPFLIEQTITTLNYAMRAQGIQKKILKNTQEEGQKQYVCLNCKKKSKKDESEAGEIKKSFILKSSDIIEQLYDDIICNARQNQKLQQITVENRKNEWQKLQQVNVQQGQKLKQVFMNVGVNLIQQTKERKRGKQEGMLGSIDMNEENSNNQMTKSITQLRRRKSHNKFQVRRKSTSHCKTSEIQ